MPPTRRTRNSGGPITKGGQKALSFNQTKNTKPTAKDLEKEKSVSSDISPAAPTTIDVGHVSSEAAVAQQAAAEVSKPEPTKEEIEAAGVTDAQIRRYWKAREAERRTPRLHQEGLGVEEKILRLWDMSSQYGPAIGIARMKRWVRANKLGLSPPIEVLAVLLKEEKKNNTKIERAYVDELLSSNAAAGDA
ncbi:hypothetical protein OIDMADRAFT_180319 [Oidiodendron maius Zn]|uniref:DNA polymerase delta subunit 4 n=1 Tax=Oidiodendron maius (strain Zn) TaxID=913774 RepID=A0A0C3HGK3_OIDMZ|nr:hypothetical protein OIDMADRAFT_180319 [Oidiodendron maius Zn]